MTIKQKKMQKFEKYTNYSCEEFLNDDFFIASSKHPTRETIAFWNEAIEKQLIDKKEFDLARNILLFIQSKQERMLDSEMLELWEKIEIDNKANLNKKSKHERMIFIFIAAASILLAIAFSIYQMNYRSNDNLSSSIENVKAPSMNSSDIYLMLGENQTVPLKGDTVKVCYKGDKIKVNEKATNLSAEKDVDNQNAYNQLVVPYGKHSMLTFNDGTNIWVNSGTRVVYPVTFDKKEREIYVDGEIYLTVTHNEKWPFTVKTNRMKVEVLGTSFNVTAYAKDAEQRVVLVNGKVIITKKDKHLAELHPNEMFEDNGSKAKIEKVDVENYILWKDGLYRYESEHMDMIMKRLSRYYNVHISCNADVSFLKCSGKLDLNLGLNKVLDAIAITAPITYNIQNNTYIIKSSIIK